MRTLPPGLQDHLQAGATTLCWCWRLTRKDGVVQGFTDHDRDITFDGTTFEAAAGLTAGDLSESVDLGVDTIDVDGALSSPAIAEADLLAGRYDEARVEIFRVNWLEPAQRLLMRVGSIGEVQAADGAFRAEVRSLAHYLQQPRGRVFQYTCDAQLGDARCRVDLETPQMRATVTVVSAEDGQQFVASGADAFEAGWFSGGTLTFETGANAGDRRDIMQHQVSGVSSTVHEFLLWTPATHDIAPGVQATVTAGCDKHLTTCNEKFANGTRFRGFPFMPGNDFLTRIASRRG
jgi:uncharacterized phage protein (TIGR02218 family)